ncbi:MAG: hypothetical protein ABR860_06975 [Terracidiphilus sp.]|jgi:hypothetical protein
MASLWDQLNEIYPSVLSADSEQSINGTQLLAKVQPKLTGDYAEGSIRQHFSDMSKDPTSKIARVTSGHGYYLRNPENVASDQPASPELPPPALTKGRDSQPEEKFRSIFIKYSEEVSRQFPIYIEHTKASRKMGGVNKWKFPDVILLSWGIGKVTDEEYVLDQDALTVKTSLGEPSFSLESVELKDTLSLATLRETFFQCVSNSKWAHRSTLAVANSIADETLRDELKRLGASYDVSVISFGLSDKVLEELPNANEIRQMTAADFENQITGRIALSVISTGKERPTLDWEHLNDLRSQSGDFRDLFEWIAYCLSQKKAHTVEEFRQIRKLTKKR